MYLESEKFIIRKIEEKDKENICKLEHENKFLKPLMDRVEESEAIIWNIYKDATDCYAIIRKQDNSFLGLVEADINDEPANVEITAFKNVDFTGFAEEIFIDFLNQINKKYGIETVIVISNDKDDPSRLVYKEIGYEFEEDEEQIEIDIPLLGKKFLDSILDLANDCNDIDEFKIRFSKIVDEFHKRM